MGPSRVGKKACAISIASVGGSKGRPLEGGFLYLQMRYLLVSLTRKPTDPE